MALFRRSKNTKKPLFGQVLSLIPKHILNFQIQKHKSDKGCSKYKTYDQLVALIFGQLNMCYSLSSISCGLSVNSIFLSDIDLNQSPSKTTMSDGNKNRNFEVFKGLYFSVLSYYKQILQKQHKTAVIDEIKNEVIKLIDSSTISLCYALFDWAKFRTAKGGIKIHTCLDNLTGLPDIVNITEAKTHDSKGFEDNVFEKGTIIVEDRGYFDFSLMLKRVEAENFFVTRIKENTVYETIKELELPENEDQDILKDEIIELTSTKAKEIGISKQQLRLITVYKEDENKVIHIICNNLFWKARTIADLYKKRWDIELFFKAMKQNLQIKTFVGTSENAVKSQIFVALITYLLLELIRRTNNQVNNAFSVLCDKIRICLLCYVTIEYVCKDLKPTAKRVQKPPDNDLFSKVNSIKQYQMAL